MWGHCHLGQEAFVNPLRTSPPTTHKIKINKASISRVQSIKLNIE